MSVTNSHRLFLSLLTNTHKKKVSRVVSCGHSSIVLVICASMVKLIKHCCILCESQSSLYEAVRLFVRNNHFVCNTALSGISATVILFTASLIAAHKSEETSVARITTNISLQRHLTWTPARGLSWHMHKHDAWTLITGLCPLSVTRTLINLAAFNRNKTTK